MYQLQSSAVDEKSVATHHKKLRNSHPALAHLECVNPVLPCMVRLDGTALAASEDHPHGWRTKLASALVAPGSGT